MKKYFMVARRALLGVFAALAFVLIITPGTAHADICGNGGTGYCLNDWNGNTNLGAAVKMYNGGVSNENFQAVQLTSMCDGGLATSTCPINVSGVNLAGYPIVKLQYNNSSKCVGTNSSSQAVLGTCPDSSGNGGSNGTIFVRFYNSNCAQFQNNSFAGFLANRYWTNNDGQLEDLFSGGNPGVQAFFGGGNGTCWGGL